MKKLIITAHPSRDGFTHKIAEKYAQGSQERGDEAEIFDLYNTDLQQDFLYFENPKKFLFSSAREAIQDKIKSCDELVFVFPLWWMDAPAILKNFVDNNFTSGFAYRYENYLPIGLLNKRARVFITCDGSRWLYFLVLTPFKIIWKYFILKFCGIKVSSFVIFDRMFRRSEDVKNRWLKKVYEMGKA